jgi:hypothetical protein
MIRSNLLHVLVKKNLSLLLAAVATISFAPRAASAALLYEPFDYPNGNLGTSTPASGGNTNPTAPASENSTSNTNVWTVSANVASNTQVTNGDLTYSGLPTTTTGHMALASAATGNPVRIGTGEYSEGSTIYYSMLVQVPSGVTNMGSSTTTGSFFAGFQYNPSTVGPAPMTDTTAGAGGVLTVHKSPTDSTAYNLGIGYRDVPAGTSRVFDTTNIHAGDTVFLVGRWDLVTGSQNDIASLYINPDPTQPEPATANAVSKAVNSPAGTSGDYLYTTTGSQIESKIRSFFLRNNGVEPTSMNIDEVRIGSSWGEVTGQIVVPEPMTIGLLSIAVVGALAVSNRVRGC